MFSQNYYHAPSLWIFKSQWNYLKLEIGIQDSLWRQWNGFEDFKILNFCKILLKFAIVFKIFEFFCPFLSLTIITDPGSFSSHADVLRDKIQRQIVILKFLLRNMEAFLKFCDILQILKISVFYLNFSLTWLEN